MSQFFIFLYSVLRKRRWFLWIGLSLIALLFSQMALKLELIQDVYKILPSALSVGKEGNAFEQSKVLDKLLINISLTDSSHNSAVLMEFADSLGQKLESDSIAGNRIKEIRMKLPDELNQQTYSYFHKNIPLFLSEKDYQEIEKKLEPDQLKASIQNGIKLMTLPSSGFLRAFYLSDPLFLTPMALAKLSALQTDTTFGLDDGYMVSKDGKHLLLLIQPRFPASNIKQNTLLLNRLDELIGQINLQYKDHAKAQYFGGVAVAVCNAKQVEKDVYLTLSLSLVLISIMIWGYYRRLSITIALLIPVAFGMLFAAAMTWWVQGHMAAIAMASGAVVLGIIIDYSTHYFSHYQHTKSIKQTLKDITLPLLIGNISTVGAFFSLTFADSVILSDFGLFAGFSLVGGSLFTLIILPHLSKQYKHTENQGRFAKVLEIIGRYKPEKNKWLVLGSIALTVIFFFLYDKVQFNGNLSELNYITEDLKKAEEEIFRKESQSERTIYLSFNGSTEDEAIRNAENAFSKIQNLEQNSTVSSLTNPALIFPSAKTQKEKTERWKNFWSEERTAKLSHNLTLINSELGLKPAAFQPFIQKIQDSRNQDKSIDEDFVKQNFLKDFLIQDGNQFTLLASLKAPVAEAGFVNRFLRENTDASVLDRQFLTTKLLDSVKDNFNRILLITSLMVFLILLISYGRIELALMTFFPMVICWIWILGLMVVLGIEFNVVNVIISTFIFGLGDDFSIFIMDGLQAEYREGKNNLDSFKTAIVLSMLTTLVGVGVLIFAKHPALHSIALISVVGIFCAMYIAFIFIPLFFKWLITDRAKKGLPPATFFGITRSIFAFNYYLLGCIILTIIGITLFKILRLKNERVKLFYHWVIMWMGKSLIYIMYMVKKRIINPQNEDFAKPAVIVANHQSFLDILSIVMLHPKLIFFTNNWVWNSPFFGRLVQMADFYSVDNGIESSLDLVRKKIALGYSIVIFPEGARSTDGSIKRFHKGAFFLAEELQLEILPIVLHGTALCMSKYDYLLSKGMITMNILPRLPPDEMPYKEKAKLVSGLIKAEYQKLNTPEFFRYRLIQNYIMKGPIVEWYMRIKTSLEKNYGIFDQHIPQKGLIYDLGCGYGFMSHMLHWTQPGRKIIGIDYDEGKIATASHVKKYGDQPPTFFEGDVTSFKPEQCDGIILADVLHYLDKKDQTQLLQTCLSALKPNGIFLLRDGDADQKEKHTNTRWTELFSTRLLGFNKTNVARLQFASLSEILKYVSEVGGFSTELIEKSEVTSNTILKITRLQNN